MSSGHVDLKFSWGLSKSDPGESSVLFVGQTSHLNALQWDHVREKLEPKVTEEVWRRGLQCIQAAPGDVVELYPCGASLASLGGPRVSRHSPPARTHVLAKVLRQVKKVDSIVLVCRKCDVYASAACIARSFPLFSLRSAGGALLAGGDGPAPSRTLSVEIALVDTHTDSNEKPIPSDSVLATNTLSEQELGCLVALAESTRLAARLTDTPANIMNVDQFIQEAVAVAKSLKLAEPTVIRGSELKARGMGGLYGVGAAADSEPALVVLTYSARGAAETVAWVGKGIVYDTGGLSLKARTSMVGMKGDCGGAAGVLGAFAALVRAEPCVNLHAVLCLAENAVGPKATRPDDIHQLYSGRSVEINNTDAEGRLVLSDGVVYAARDLKADTIVDMATLTGAQGTATGKYHAAVLSNSEALEAQCVRAGYASGDLAHALPFAPDLHFPEFASQVADMKNSVADRNNAQPSCAGLFILAHLGFEFPGRWLHVDMAAPALAGERATGYGVALLTVLFGHHTRSKMLQALSPGPVAGAAARGPAAL